MAVPPSPGVVLLPLPSSSGDLVADRRLGYARALADAGDLSAAAEVLAGALVLAPGWVAGWSQLGDWYQAAGAAGPAVEAFERALRLDPEDRLGVGLKRDLLRQVPLAETMPTAFVETLFDAYAPSFEAELVGRLDYRAPQAIREALPARRFASALDIGCGTGLSGVAVAPLCDRLEGWDISAAMLREAEAKGIYAALERRDLSDLAPVAATWDLLVAADVFLYLGALERILGWSRAALLPDGVLAFTVEACEGTGFELGEARRYRHSATYLRGLLAEAGFAGIELCPTILRQDRGRPVEGFVVVATAPALRPDREDEAEAAMA